MIQLKVYNNASKGSQQFLDLYDTEPIKLNLSVEDITNAEAKSVFSRTFRVPASRRNNQFFKTAFEVEGQDYNVTVKKPAEIIVDGAEFRQGHIRLQRIFINGAQDKIDYEIIFLGETRDFSSAIGDAAMCDLLMTDLAHVKSGQNIVTSWNTYPTSGFTSNDGLAFGNVVYPMVDFGNSYDENGNVEQATFNPNDANNIFQGGYNGTALKTLEVARMKPIVRVKRCLDELFDNAGYQYESIFLDSEFFKQIYLSAWGNTADVYQPTDITSINTFSATDFNTQAADDYLEVQETISDPGNNYGAASIYTVPNTAPGLYTFDGACLYNGDDTRSGVTSYVDGRLLLVDPDTYVPGTGTGVYVTGAYGAGQGQIITVQGSFTLGAGDRVALYCEADGASGSAQTRCRNKEFACLVAPGESLPSNGFDCDYKQIEFLKDVLTTFRLVMAPKRNDPTTFIIEPFVNYIASGQLHDWSSKLVNEKDFQIQPLFFTQSDEIEFKHEEDDDYINKYHREAYKETYGYLRFDSGNELLTGSREIATKWAPTPMARLEGTAANSPFIIPQIHVHESGDGGTEHLPIKPKTRFLFFNGLQPTGGNGHQNHWYLQGIEGDQANDSWSVYPLASYSSEWPLQSDGIILNWFNDIGYWGNAVTGYPSQGGQSLYNTYWGGYIDSLYSRFARRVTATFILNNVDLQDFSFDDVIFVNGSYYRPEKITDAEIGDLGETKVELIKLLDYKPIEQINGSIALVITTNAPSCFQGANGSVTVDTTQTDITYPISWQIGTLTGTAMSMPFTINNLIPATYALTVTDAQGRTTTQTVTVPQSSATQLNATANITQPTDCNTSDGAITITPSGGTAPYQIFWDDQQYSGFTLTGLGNSELGYTIEDDNGCEIERTVLVSCQVVIPTSDITLLRSWEIGGLCQGETVGESFDAVVIKVDDGTNTSPTNGYYVWDSTWANLYAQYGPSGGQNNGIVIMRVDVSEECPAEGWFYSPLADGIYDALDLLLACECGGGSTNEFYNAGTVQSQQNLIFVAELY